MQVVASAVMSMSAEVAASRSRLEELLARKDEADGEADSDHHQDRGRQDRQRQNTQPAQQNNTQYSQDTERQFEFPTTHVEDNQDTQVRHSA